MKCAYRTEATHVILERYEKINVYANVTMQWRWESSETVMRSDHRTILINWRLPSDSSCHSTKSLVLQLVSHTHTHINRQCDRMHTQSQRFTTYNAMYHHHNHHQLLNLLMSNRAKWIVEISQERHRRCPHVTMLHINKYIDMTRPCEYDSIST